MSALRTLSLLSVLGGVVSAALMWSHGHPHDMWSLWTLSDLAAIGLMVAGLRFANRRVSAEPPAASVSTLLAESRRQHTGVHAPHGVPWHH